MAYVVASDRDDGKTICLRQDAVIGVKGFEKMEVELILTNGSVIPIEESFEEFQENNGDLLKWLWNETRDDG